MPTKAQMQEELDELRSKLAELRGSEGSEESGDVEDHTSGDAGDIVQDAASRTFDWAKSQLGGGEKELERLFKEFTDELGDLQENKPLLTLFGAFLLGYLLGRAREGA